MNNKQSKSLISIMIASVLLLVIFMLFMLPAIKNYKLDKQLEEEIMSIEFEMLDPIDIDVINLKTSIYLNERAYDANYTKDEIYHVMELIDSDLKVMEEKAFIAKEQIHKAMNQKEKLYEQDKLLNKMNKTNDRVLQKIENDKTLVNLNVITADDAHEVAIEMQITLLDFRYTLEDLLDIL